MGTAFAELALVHDQDSVGTLDGGEAMRYENGGSPGDHAGEGETDANFGVGVDGGRGFVEDEDAGRVGECARLADELFLARGEGGSAFADGLGKLLREEIADEVAYVDFVAGLLEAARR